MPDPEEPSGFLLSDSKKTWQLWGLAHTTNVLVLGNWSIPRFHFSGAASDGMFWECARRGPRRGCPAQCLETEAPFVLQQVMRNFFLQSISPNEKWCNLALNIFFQIWKILKDVERKQSCIRIQIALPKEKPFYCGSSYNYAFRYVFQSPCKTLWQIFSAETTGWERTHNSRGSQREVRFAEFFLSSEGKNDLVSLQDLYSFLSLLSYYNNFAIYQYIQ